MANSSEISTSDIGRGREETQATKNGLQSSGLREAVASMETRMERMGIAVGDNRDFIEELSQRVESLEEHVGNLFEDCKGFTKTVFEKLDEILADWSQKWDSMQAEMVATREEMREGLKKIDVELFVCKQAIASGRTNSASAPRVDAPKIKPYRGARNAREIDNFLWSLDQYLEAGGIPNEAQKVKTDPVYLTDMAILWRRRRMFDIERGAESISTLDEFKGEFKRQFYPEDVEYEAPRKVRHLKHCGSIGEYVREIQEVILDLPKLTDEDALFAFVEGLQDWTKTDVRREKIHDLATTIFIAEHLSDYSEHSSSSPPKGKGGGAERKKPHERREGGSKPWKSNGSTKSDREKVRHLISSAFFVMDHTRHVNVHKERSLLPFSKRRMRSQAKMSVKLKWDREGC